MTADLEVYAAHYDDFGRRWAHGTSPLYEEWAVGIADDAEALAHIVALPRLKRQPNLVFACARWLGCPLTGYRDFREWFLAHVDDVAALASTRATQTNEATRCATLLPVLSRIDGPVALLETGTAAGLCLHPDRYSYRYATPDGPRALDPASGPSEVVLDCRLDDAAAAPERMPEVVWRAGIDLSPIDPADSDAVAWLANLIWPGPDHDTRVARLRGAAAIAASDRARVVAGDIREQLEPLVAEAPADATLVVFHSAVLLYLDADGRREFAATIDRVRAGRDLVWLSNEGIGTLPVYHPPVPDALDTHHRFVQTVDTRPVALAGQHGATYEVLPFR
ncbi:DUF2332 domain-containing protein [Microbacterium sp. bgisy189]|uniref:DUF2332 domain-containing protein n=1 Tax=Microbacterium sp. bgisy189 TaxID=3413798 RepID=UPI003EB78DA7